MSNLYRKEVDNFYKNSRFGVISLSQPLSIKLYICITMIISISWILFLFIASYNQHVTVFGELVPKDGVSKIISPSNGTLESFDVHEGDRVKVNQRLCIIKMPSRLNQMGYVKELILEPISKSF